MPIVGEAARPMATEAAPPTPARNAPSVPPAAPAIEPARSPTAETIRSALNHRGGLSRFPDDGRVEIDSNSVERAMRPSAVRRKNAVFAGTDAGGDKRAAVASLIETPRLNGIDPQRYLTGLLTRLVNGWPQARSDALMPWNCTTETNA